MRKILSAIRACVVSACLASVLAFAACSNDIDSASTTAGMDNSADDDMALNDNDGKSDKANRKDTNTGSGSDSSGGTVKDFGDNFIRGFDASAVDYYENNVDGKGAVTYKDADGTTLDFFKILVNHGYDTVRLRIWVDPSQKINASDNPPVGDNTLERTISMAKRIKSAGLNLMLDFHYSDYWTDPSKQFVPVSWQNLSSAEEVSSKISEYTTEVLKSISDEAGIVPSHVQIGNEINNGLLLSTGTTDSIIDFAHAAGNTSENVKAYLAAASKAVRDFNGEIKIIVHVTSSNQPTKLLDTLKTAELDYDIIGLSYYPWEASHGTIVDMKNEVGNWKTTYGKPVMIAECSAQFDGSDDTIDKLLNSARHMIDPETSEIYSDLETADSDDAAYIVGSVANAKAIVRHIMQETYDAGGIGCVAWGGEMHGDWDRAMFDWSGKAMDNIDAFNYKPSDGYPAEDASDAGGSEENEKTMTLTLSFPENSSAASVSVKYWAADGSDSSSDTKTATVSNNSASVTLSNSYSSEWGFNGTVTIYDSSSNDITSNFTLNDSKNYGTCSKFWFEFSEGGTQEFSFTETGSNSDNAGENAGSNSSTDEENNGDTTENETLPYTATSFPFEKSYTGTGSNETFLTKESFANVSGTTVTIAFTWVSGSGTPWFGVGDSWPEISWNESTASGTTTVEELKSNDLVIGAPTGAGFTVTISIE